MPEEMPEEKSPWPQRKESTVQEESLSPSTQALLLAALLRRPWREQWHPADELGALRHTGITWSRAVRQIVALGVATVQVQGRVRGLRMHYSARETWARVHSKLCSPVQRTLWARLPTDKKVFASARLAGLSALARHSMLIKPAVSTYALGLSDWEAARVTGWAPQPEPEEGASEIQIWTYSPAWVEGPEVDPLSLWLSLQDEKEARVEAARHQLMEAVAW